MIHYCQIPSACHSVFRFHFLHRVQLLESRVAYLPRNAFQPHAARVEGLLTHLQSRPSTAWFLPVSVFGSWVRFELLRGLFQPEKGTRSNAAGIGKTTQIGRTIQPWHH